MVEIFLDGPLEFIISIINSKTCMHESRLQINSLNYGTS